MARLLGERAVGTNLNISRKTKMQLTKIKKYTKCKHIAFMWVIAGLFVRGDWGLGVMV